MRMRHRRTATGFTLIELLVVIAIIGLLVSILLPSLAGAKDLARTAACKSEFRNVGLAMAQYVGDARDVIPPGRMYIGAERIQLQHLLYEGNYLTGVTSDTQDVPDTTNVLRCAAEDATLVSESDLSRLWGDYRGADYRNDPARMRVDAIPRIDADDNVEYYVHTSYGFNGGNAWAARDLPHNRWSANGETDTGSGVTRTQDLEIAPAEIISMYDGYGYHVSACDFHSARHNGGDAVNVLCLDGHAETIESENLSSVGKSYAGDAEWYQPGNRPNHWIKPR